MRLIKPLNQTKQIPLNGFFEWLDEFSANASKKVFEPLIDTYVGSTVNIVGGAGKGIGTYLGNEQNISNLIDMGIASQTGGLIGTKTKTGTGTGTNEFEDLNTSNNTIKYVLGGLAVLSLGYLLLKK